MRLLGFAALLLVAQVSLCAAPSITGVYNAASWLPTSLPNSGVAQGALFTIYGSGLGPATIQRAESFPLPTTQGLAGTSITVTVGAVTENCIMLYTLAIQVAAVLPSATPVGTGTLTVTYQGAKSTIAIQVIAAGFGTFTLNENGNGPAVVTDANFNPITYVNAAHPGDTLVLWGTGLGAVTGDETEPPVTGDLGTGVQVFIENQPATVLYGGRSSSAGVDQVNFIVPQGISGGCKTSIAVLVKGVVGNVTSTAIMPAGQTVCNDSYGTVTGADLQKAVTTGTLKAAAIDISRISTDNDMLNAQFFNYPLSTVLQSFGGAISPSIGSCISYELTGSALVVNDPVQPPNLDPGSSLAITGPSGTKTVADSSTGNFAGTLGTSSSVYIKPGSYSASNGNGGANVGPFNWSVTLPSPVVPTNLPATISRSQNLTLTWAGGAAFPVVTVTLYSGVPISTNLDAFVELDCSATGSAGQFTIPSVLLNLLPTNGYGSPGAPGAGIQIAGVALNRVTASGLDDGIIRAYTSTGGIAKVQ
jgi:uncharacterized protein (TIGR03437 family)